MPNEITVSVKMLAMGLKTYELNITGDMTVGDFKEAIAEKDGQVNGDQYRLTYDNKELTGEETLIGDLIPAVEEWSVFTVVLKPSQQQEQTRPRLSESSRADVVGRAAPVPSAPPLEITPAVRYIKVQPPTGSVVLLSLDEDETIYNLKDRLQSETETPIASQKLLYNGTVLSDSTSMQFFGSRGRTQDTPVLITMLIQTHPFDGTPHDLGQSGVRITATQRGWNRTVTLEMDRSDTVYNMKRKICTEYYLMWEPLPTDHLRDIEIQLGSGKIAVDDDDLPLSHYYDILLQFDPHPEFVISFSVAGQMDVDCGCCSIWIPVGICTPIFLGMIIAGAVLLSVDNLVVGIILMANGGMMLLMLAIISFILTGCCGLCNEGESNDDPGTEMVV